MEKGRITISGLEIKHIKKVLDKYFPEYSPEYKANMIFALLEQEDD